MEGGNKCGRFKGSEDAMVLCIEIPPGLSPHLQEVHQGIDDDKVQCGEGAMVGQSPFAPMFNGD